MITKSEILSILGITIVLAISASLFRDINLFPATLLSFFLVITINVLAKKIASFYLDSEIEMKVWQIEGSMFRWFGRPVKYKKFEEPFKAGIYFPLISKIIFYPLGSFIWMASLIFEIKPKVYRAAKRHGLYSYSELNESHIGLIAAAGIVANIFFAFVGYLIGFSEFSRINIYMAFFNILPLSDLDGNKILFGNMTLWTVLVTLILISVCYTIFLI